MTREEIIDGLEIYTAGRPNKDRVHITVKELQKFIDEIKELEKEPCDDAISREQAIKIFTYNYKGERIPDYDCDNFPIQIAMKTIKKTLRELPSVTPQQKVGHWITTRTFMHDGEFYCDKCKCDSPNNEKWDYCPNCGCVMKGELE